MSEMQTKVHVHDGKVTFESIQDCTPIAEQTMRLHNEGAVGSSEMKHAARIPHIIVEQYCHRNNILFSEFMGNKDHIKAVLNDPSLSAFRVWKGRV